MSEPTGTDLEAYEPDVEPEIAEHLLAAIRIGMEPARAALAFGVSSVQLARIEGVDQAVAQGELLYLQRAAEGGSGWEAQKWVLERRFAERWGRTAVVQHVAGVKSDTTTAPGRGDVVDETRMERLRREREERANAASHAAGS